MKNSSCVVFLLALVLSLFFVSPAETREPGDRVLGQWGDGYWYPATIVSTPDTGSENSRYKVIFDDGDEDVITESRLTDIDWTSGTDVQCNWKGKGRYYPGTITKKQGLAIHVAYADGDNENTVIGRCRQQR